MTAVAKREVNAFFARVELRIVQETNLASTPGLRPTARLAASHRAADFTRDLTYLRAVYGSAPVMVGQGGAR